MSDYFKIYNDYCVIKKKMNGLLQHILKSLYFNEKTNSYIKYIRLLYHYDLIFRIKSKNNKYIVERVFLVEDNTNNNITNDILVLIDTTMPLTKEEEKIFYTGLFLSGVELTFQDNRKIKFNLLKNKIDYDMKNNNYMGYIKL